MGCFGCLRIGFSFAAEDFVAVVGITFITNFIAAKFIELQQCFIQFLAKFCHPYS